MANRKPGQRRTPAQREAHQARILDVLLHEPRRSSRDIARELGVEHATALDDIKAVRRRLAEQFLDRGAEAAGLELEHLRTQRELAYQGWARSLEERTSERVSEHRVEKHVAAEVGAGRGSVAGTAQAARQAVPGGETRTAMELKKERAGGDPRYLGVALNATRAIVAMLGLNEPQRLALSQDADEPLHLQLAGDTDYLAGVLAVMERANLFDPAVIAAADRVALPEELEGLRTESRTRQRQ